uniref:Uncharacterized protein n=1 Tax=Romanomermis culicivorax TaxID=13658 RepID=A0A915J956_ROMCU
MQIADQSCDKPFAIRNLPIKEAIQYHEIGSGPLNPASVNFATKLSHWHDEGLIGPSSQSYHANIEPVKQILDENYSKLAVDWQSVTFNECLYGLNGPFLGEDNRTRRIEAISVKNRIMSNNVCSVSATSQMMLRGSICFWFVDHKFNDHGCFEGQLQISVLTSFFVKDYELCTEHIDDNIHFSYYHQDEVADYEFSPENIVDKVYCDFDPLVHWFYQQWTMLTGRKEHEEALVYMTYENCELATTIVVNKNQILFGPVKEDCYFCTDYEAGVTKISPENCRNYKTKNGKWRRFCYCYSDKSISLNGTNECTIGHLAMEVYSSKDPHHPINHSLMPFKICARR